VIVTAHQPNFLPGKSVVQKLSIADAVVWLDEVQYTKGGYINRNHLPDGRWITVPVERLTDGKPINRVRIADDRIPPWNHKMLETIGQAFGRRGVFNDVRSELLRPYRLLIGLNLGLMRALRLHELCEWHFQSHLDGGHAVKAVSEDAEELLPISDRLAMMVSEIGGTTYLSGPSGRRYLDEAPFNERGIRVEYFEFTGDNPSVLTMLAKEELTWQS